MLIIIIKIDITIFITLIWKSVEIHANCLALTDAMKSRIAPFFCVFFPANKKALLKHNQSDFKASL